MMMGTEDDTDESDNCFADGLIFMYEREREMYQDNKIVTGR